MLEHERLIETMYKLGLSVHYDRVLQLSTELGNRVTKIYRMYDVIYLVKYHKGLFITAADNINHQTSATTCDTAFNGTGISLNQQ